MINLEACGRESRWHNAMCYSVTCFKGVRNIMELYSMLTKN